MSGQMCEKKLQLKCAVMWLTWDPLLFHIRINDTVRWRNKPSSNWDLLWKQNQSSHREIVRLWHKIPVMACVDSDWRPPTVAAAAVPTIDRLTFLSRPCQFNRRLLLLTVAFIAERERGPIRFRKCSCDEASLTLTGLWGAVEHPTLAQAGRSVKKSSE